MEKHYILYRTTNRITGHYYIGVHGQIKDDGYLGSGIRLKRQLAKYGRENFVRSTLAIFSSEAEAFAAEIEALQDHLGHPLCLNISHGGDGGANFKKLEGPAKARREVKSQELRESRRRVCPQCGEEFFGTREAQVYCSRKCVARSNYKAASAASRQSPKGSLSEAHRKAVSEKMMGTANALKSQTREEIALRGRLSAHKRWHVAREIVSDSCEFCDKQSCRRP